jgi:hypothetical protein
MAQQPAKIHIGAGRIFLNVTAPATGTPPTLTTHTSGVPGTGTEAGYTKDASTFTYKQTKQPIEAEQSLNPVDVFITTEECQLEFTAMEHTYNTLKTAFDNIGTVTDGAKDLFYAGDGLGLLSVNTQCVVLSSPRRDAPTKFEVLTLYKVYNVDGITVAYSRKGEAVYKVMLKALVDQTRNAGDRLFQWFREA